MRSAWPRALAFAATLAATGTAAAEQPARFTPERVALATWIDSPQIAPDGSRILYSKTRWAPRDGEPAEGIWVMASDGTDARFLTAGSRPRWSADSGSFAFLAPAADGSEQLFIYELARAASRQLTQAARAPAMATWSPDGSTIAFTALVPEEAPWAIELPPLPQRVEQGEPPVIIDELHYRLTGVGLLERGYEHLFVLPASGDAPARQLTHGRWHVGARESGRTGRMSYGFAWMPDGRSILIDGLNSSDHDLRAQESDIHVVSISDGSIRRLTWAVRKGFWSSPRVSPDGKHIAYHGYEWDRPHASRPLSLWIAESDGRNPRNLTASVDEDAAGFFWAPGGEGLFFNVGRHGRRSLYFAPLEGSPKPVPVSAELDLRIHSLSRDGIAVGLTTGATQLPEIVRLDLRDPAKITRLTRVSDELLDGVDLGESESFWYTGPQGVRLQAWVFYPPGFTASQRYPLVTYLHGGPRYMGNASLDWLGMFSVRNLTAEGYVVLYPNYRGNDGYGTAVADSIVGHWPNEDAAGDVHAAIDQVVARGWVDSKRMALIGESAGGALAAWMLGHTQRFSSAIALWPDTDWIHSSLAADDALLSFRRFPKPLWEDPRPWLQQSPIFFADRITTPLLLMAGDQDLRTPIAHIEELFTAMKIAGRAPVRMVRLVGQEHGYSMTLPNYIRMQHYVQMWLEGRP